jgi:carbonic anhydrase
MEQITQLFENNKRWARKTAQTDPFFFLELSKVQSPEILWIGCSDSRVPPNIIVDLPPGALFVHRNIANVMIHTDINSLSVLHYAVDVLKVKHIVICGHNNCGGVTASLKGNEHGLIDNWLRHIQEIAAKWKNELDPIDDIEKKADRLSELNVMEQVKNVEDSPIVQKARQKGQQLNIHGFMFDLSNGILKDLRINM